VPLQPEARVRLPQIPKFFQGMETFDVRHTNAHIGSPGFLTYVRKWSVTLGECMTCGGLTNYNGEISLINPIQAQTPKNGLIRPFFGKRNFTRGKKTLCAIKTESEGGIM
jgi:hypothetical protein